MNVFTRICAAAILLFFVATNMKAGKLIHLLDYNISSFPTVESNLFVFDSNNKVVENLNDKDFVVRDNGSIVNPADVHIKCSEQNPLAQISMILTIDLAISTPDKSGSNLDFAKEAAKLFIRRFDSKKSHCALTSFDSYSYLNQEFTNDTAKLINSLNYLYPGKISDYNTALGSLPVGAIEVAKPAMDEKIIFVITDGKAGITPSEIIPKTKENNIKVYFLILEHKIPNYLKKFCDTTGGKWCDNVFSEEDLDAAVNSLLSLAYGYKPCLLYWISELNCDAIRYVTVSIPKDTIQDDFNYVMPDEFKPRLDIDNPYLAFSSVLPGANRTLSVTITAKNTDITIFNLSIAHPYFKILNNITSPKTLMNNESYTINIEFAPLDSALVYDSLVIESSACFGKDISTNKLIVPAKILITGGFPNTPPKERNLTLENPKCKDILIAGDTTTVRWSGVLPFDVIQLEYKTEKDTSWQVLAKDMTGLDYVWKVPDIDTDSCLARVVQLWPNNIGQTMNFRHNGSVNTANFNNDGNMVVTASTDKTAKIWNSNNGKLIHTLQGHTKSVNWANFNKFDQDDKYIVTSSDDSTAKLWDIKSGKLIRTFRGHNHIVKSANFSPDGSKIVTASYDGKLILWETETGNALDTISFKNEDYYINLWYATYNSTGDYILATDYRGKVRIWSVLRDTIGFAFYADTNINKQPIPYASFSPNEDKIAAACWAGYACVWQFNNQKIAFAVSHASSTIAGIISNYTANFDQTGNILLTAGGRDMTARRWDANTGELIDSLKEHTGLVTSAVFNFDGSRILTSSWDSTAKVWNLEKRDLQMDTSDCYFSIAHAIAEANDVDFGKVASGEAKDTLVEPLIINKSKFPYKISSMSIKGVNKEDFRIIEPDDFLPFIMDSSEEKAIELRFEPTDIGPRQAELDIVIPGDTITIDLLGEGYDPGLQAVSDYIDFLYVELGDYKDTTITYLVKNKSKSVIHINKIEIQGPDDEHFDIVKGGIIDTTKPITLQPDAYHEMTLRFTPEELARKNGKLVFEHDGQGAVCTVLLFGQGIPPIVDTATIAIASFEGKPGDIVDVPIYIKDVTNYGVIENFSGFNAELTFNSSLLEPIDGDYDIDIEDGIRKLKLTLPTTDIKDSTVLGTIRFRVALGNDTLTPLNLNTVPIGVGKVKLYDVPGIFNLIGTCKEGGLRLFNSDGKIFLSQNRPNPFDNYTEIEFEVIEKGYTSLFVTDMLGKVVKTYLCHHLSKGKYSVQIDATDFPTGSYYYILQTPTQRIIRRMEVNK